MRTVRCDEDRDSCSSTTEASRCVEKSHLRVDEKDDEGEQIEKKTEKVAKSSRASNERPAGIRTSERMDSYNSSEKNGATYKIYIDPNGMRHRTRPPSAGTNQNDDDALTTKNLPLLPQMLQKLPCPPRRKRQRRREERRRVRFRKCRFMTDPFPL